MKGNDIFSPPSHPPSIQAVRIFDFRGCMLIDWLRLVGDDARAVRTSCSCGTLGNDNTITLPSCIEEFHVRGGDLFGEWGRKSEEAWVNVFGKGVSNLQRLALDLGDMNIFGEDIENGQSCWDDAFRLVYPIKSVMSELLVGFGSYGNSAFAFLGWLVQFLRKNENGDAEYKPPKVIVLYLGSISTRAAKVVMGLIYSIRKLVDVGVVFALREMEDVNFLKESDFCYAYSENSALQYVVCGVGKGDGLGDWLIKPCCGYTDIVGWRKLVVVGFEGTFKSVAGTRNIL